MFLILFYYFILYWYSIQHTVNAYKMFIEINRYQITYTYYKMLTRINYMRIICILKFKNLVLSYYVPDNNMVLKYFTYLII